MVHVHWFITDEIVDAKLAEGRRRGAHPQARARVPHSRAGSQGDLLIGEALGALPSSGTVEGLPPMFFLTSVLTFG